MHAIGAPDIEAAEALGPKRHEAGVPSIAAKRRHRLEEWRVQRVEVDRRTPGPPLLLALDHPDVDLAHVTRPARREEQLSLILADGWAELDRIASQYKNVDEWEKRKADLKECLLEAIQLNHLPASPGTAPIKANFRKMNGYTIENVAIEILPGVWVNGSLYKPEKYKGKIPVVLHPQGHWDNHRYRPDCQYTSAAIAKMGAMIFNYDMFAWGESTLQFKYEYHRQSLAMTMQLLAGKRILDYLLSQ